MGDLAAAVPDAPRSRSRSLAGVSWERLPAEVLAHWLPPQRVRPSDWAQAHLRLPRDVTSMPGNYSLALHPYSREVLDAWVEPEVEEVVMQMATGAAKSTMISVLLAFTAVNDPGPALVAGATKPNVEEFSVRRLQRILDASPTTARLLPRRHDRVALRLEVGAQVVYFGWSGSVASLAERAIRWLYCTEIDKWSREKTLEADVLDLVGERTKTFPNARKLYEGTPTIVGLSRVNARFLASDRRRFHVPCPHCGTWQRLIFGKEKQPGGLKWPRGEDGHSCTADEALNAAWYECTHCGGRITDVHKPAMMRRGLWVPDGRQARPATKAEVRKGLALAEACDGTPMIVEGTAENPTTTRRGYQLSSLYSPTIPFGRVAQEWLLSLGDYRREQNFFNSWLAEPWEAHRQQLDWQAVFERCRDEREPGQVPAEAEVLILTADVQRAAIFWVLRAWTVAGASWLVAEGQTPSLTDLEELRAQSRWPMVGMDGVRGVDICALDARYRTSEVEDFVADGGPAVRAFMGGTLKYGTFRFSADRVDPRTGRPVRRGPGHWGLNSNYYQDKLDSLTHRGQGHPQRWRLPRDCRELYLRMLASEVLVEAKDARGRPVLKRVMVEGAPGNHFRDCECYQIAAWEMWRMGWARVASGAEQAAPRRPAAGPGFTTGTWSGEIG